MPNPEIKRLKRYLDEAEYAGVLRHSHIIRCVKLEFFLILRDVIALTLVPSAFYATFSAAFSAWSERTFSSGCDAGAVDSLCGEIGRNFAIWATFYRLEVNLFL